MLQDEYLIEICIHPKPNIGCGIPCHLYSKVAYIYIHCIANVMGEYKLPMCSWFWSGILFETMFSMLCHDLRSRTIELNIVHDPIFDGLPQIQCTL
jgi:hypothetical protein